MRKLVNTILAGALGLSMIAGVSAQDTGDAQINVQPNENGLVTPLITSAPDFGSVEYSFDPQVVTNTEGGAGNLVIEVTDNRGGSNGWEINISGTDFINAAETESFEVTNLVLGTGDVTATTGDPENVTPAATQPVTTEETSLITASVDNDSNGVFTITYTGNTLTVPGGTPVDEYTSTLTIETAAAPGGEE